MSRASQRRACNAANFRIVRAMAERRRAANAAEMASFVALAEADRKPTIDSILGHAEPTLPKVDTHYLPFFTSKHPSDPTFQQAACGQFISTVNNQFSVHPSCPRCEAWLKTNVDQGMEPDAASPVPVP